MFAYFFCFLPQRILKKKNPLTIICFTLFSLSLSLSLCSSLSLSDVPSCHVHINNTISAIIRITNKSITNFICYFFFCLNATYTVHLVYYSCLSLSDSSFPCVVLFILSDQFDFSKARFSNNITLKTLLLKGRYSSCQKKKSISPDSRLPTLTQATWFDNDVYFTPTS